MTCPCGCPQPVKPGNRYATRGCGGRVHLLAQGEDPLRLAAMRARAKDARAQALTKAHTAILEVIRAEARDLAGSEWRTLAKALLRAEQRAYRRGWDAGYRRASRQVAA